MKNHTEMRTDIFALVVGRMTNWQRNAWAKAHYPGLEKRELAKVMKFVPKESSLYPKGIATP